MKLAYNNKPIKLQFNYVSSLWTTCAFDDVEFYSLAFFQRFEAFSLDCGEVYEYVATLFRLDESIAFFCVKPFHFTLHA
jgi:hypothetical protein